MVAIGISLNNKTHKLVVYKFDDYTSVLKRYVSARTDSSTIVPRFLRFTDPEVAFVDGKTYKITNIRDEINDLDLDSIANEEALVMIMAKYPSVDRATIGMIWLSGHDYSSMNRELFIKTYNDTLATRMKKINKKSFINAQIAHTDLMKFEKRLQDDLVAIVAGGKAESVIYDQLETATKPDTGAFELEDTIEETFLHLPDGESLYDIFDAMDTSTVIPYIMLVDGSRVTIKVSSSVAPPDEWVKQLTSPTMKGIIFYVLDSAQESLTDDEERIKKMYSPGFWSEGNSVKLSIRLIGGNTADQLRDKVLESVGGRIEYKIVNQSQMGVRGKFSIHDISFNRAIFAEMIFNNPSFSYFLFLDEKEKSSSSKPRFTFYYEPNHHNEFTSSLTITITPVPTSDGDVIDVRVARASTLRQVDSFMVVFQHLIGLYLDGRDAVVKLYKNLYDPVAFDKFVRKPAAKKTDKKTGKRLADLQRYNPDAFAEGYSSKCQPRHRQPYLVNPADIENLKQKLKEKGGTELEKYGLLNWPHDTGDWFSCYPRDDNETDQRYIWPGVIKQSETAANFGEYPYPPCCFLHNQYTKKGGNLVKYLAAAQRGDTEGEFDETVFGRPLGDKKLTPRGRFAELPYYMQIVMGTAGYKAVEDKRKTFLPVVRHGVIRGPDSFIHCLEKATNTNYSSLSVKKKSDRVRTVLDKISREPNYTIGRQEMFDTSDEEIREHLSSEGAYIDPDMYISIMEKYYNCNIVVFQVDDSFPDGELVTPRHSVAYLARKLDTSRKTIIVVKHAIPAEWLYQCEIVVEYASGKLKYFFDDGPLVELLSDLMTKINTIYITSTSGKYLKYIPATM